MNKLRKFYLYSLFMILFLCLIFSNRVYTYNTKAKIMIKLQDKNNIILPNLQFNIYGEDNELISNAITDNNGEFLTQLDKGKNYIIEFKYMDRDWKFNLSVPDKPGPRSYNYNFKVMIESDTQTFLQAKTKFEEKIDKTKCKTKIMLKDDSGMPIPLQEFTIKSLDADYKSFHKTDSNGIAIITLKNGQTFDLNTTFEGYTFNTTFNIPVETIETEFNYEVDFSKIINVEIDTIMLQFPEAFSDSLKTIIIVQDSSGTKIQNAELILEESNKIVFKSITPENGTLQTYTFREKVYELYIRKDNITYKFEMILPHDKSIKEYTYIAIVDFEFKPKRTFVLNINFDSGKWDLRNEDVPEMESLFQTMKDNPRMTIELGGHTDAIGSDASNQILSEKRANTCYRFLIDKGIEKERVKAKGYGESRPIATNKTKEGRFLNRRMEVSVIGE